METRPFPSSSRSREITSPSRFSGDSSTLSSSSDGNSPESYDPRVTVNLYFNKFKYALQSEERTSLKTSSWFSCFPRGPRSKARVFNKRRPMTDNIAEGVSAGGVSDTYPCPRSSTSQPRIRQKRRRKRKTGTKNEQSDSDEVIVCRRVRNRGCVARDWNKSNVITNERGKLDSRTFLHYFMHIWSSFPEDKVKSVTYFDPLWLELYANANKQEMVLNWIKQKGVFSKKYVLVPIVMWSHWSLLIFCYLGESLKSKTNTPCMLLLDSLHAIGPTRLEPSIRRLLLDMYESEERPESHKELKKVRFLIPKVPQQKKGDECGFYVLYFIKLFLEGDPENLDISAGYPYNMKKDWFSADDVELFCQRLDAVPTGFSECSAADDDDNDDDCVFVESR